MIKKPKISKIAIVVILTVLIWVWADLAQDERLTLAGRVKVAIGEVDDPLSWMVFKRDDKDTPKLQVVLDSVDLKGPVKNINEVRRKQDKGTLDLTLYVSPKLAGLENDGAHLLRVLDLLRQNDQIKQWGLTVENCEPQSLTVQVQHLVEKSVPVQVVDANDHALIADIDPAQVVAPVPDGEARIAKIRLSLSDQQLAKRMAVEKRPFVELAAGPPRNANQTVKVRLPSDEEALKARDIPATLGICFSRNLQGKYQVKLLNEDAFATVSIRATPAAQQEFEKQAFHIILYIRDEDAKPGTEIERDVVINFPPEYFARGEIKEGWALKKAKFTLVPIAPDVKPAAPN
jgi:hypothetical protein